MVACWARSLARKRVELKGLRLVLKTDECSVQKKAEQKVLRLALKLVVQKVGQKVYDLAPKMVDNLV